MAVQRARRGQFGRGYRVAPSLTAEIVSIANQQAAKEDDNIMSAWQKGGTVNGQKVTDEMMLAHWKERLAGVDEDDPLFDTYKQAIDQVTYAIAESKVTMAYAQKRIGEMGVANFYLQWAKKVPPHSEFYRTLQRDAAQFIQAAKARGQAGAKAAQEKAYAEARDALHEKTGKAADYMTLVLNNMSQAGDFVSDQRGDSISSYSSNDPAKILQMLGTLSSKGNDKQVLYHVDQNGNLAVAGNPGVKAVTVGDVRAQMKKADPHFDGTFSPSQYADYINQKQSGYKQLIANAIKTGHASDVRFYQNESAGVAVRAREVGMWGPEKVYDELWKARDLVMSDPSTSIFDKIAADNAYLDGLKSIAADPKMHLDDNARSRLLAEIAGDGDATTWHEDAYGYANPTAASAKTSDSAANHRLIQTFQDNITLGDDPTKGAYTFGTWSVNRGTGEAVFQADPSGVDFGAVQNAELPTGAVKVYVPTGTSGEPPIAVWAQPAPLTISVRDSNGLTAGPATPNSEVIGQTMVVPINGKQTMMFQYRDATGEMVWTTTPPFDNSIPGGPQTSMVKGHSGPGSVDFMVTLPTSFDQAFLEKVKAGGANGYAGFVMDANSATARDPLGTKAIFVGDRLLHEADPTRFQAGKNPYFDTFSPTVALILAQPDGQKLLSDMSKDPTTRQGLIDDAYASVPGVVRNADGIWTSTDPATMQKAIDRAGQTTAAMDVLNSAGDDAIKMHGVSEQWDRMNLWGDTAPPPVTSQLDPKLLNQSVSEGYATGYDVVQAKLPSVDVLGTAFNAIGTLFHPNTNVFKNVDLLTKPGVKMITGPDQIIVPKTPTPQTGYGGYGPTGSAGYATPPPAPPPSSDYKPPTGPHPL